MISKHHNYEYDASSPAGVPNAAGDRYYSQDLFRDFTYLIDRLGLVLKDLITQIPIHLSGGVCTQGTGETLNITAGFGYAKHSVQTVNSYGSTPPTTQDEDIESIRIAWTAQTNMAIPSYISGGTTNYIKVNFIEADGSTRNRAKKAGSYYYDQTPSFEFEVDDSAPTDYQICLATFTEAAGTFTFSDYNTHRTITIADMLKFIQLSTNAILKVLNTTDSTDKDTGAIVIEGGIGVEKNIHAGGTIKNDDSTDSTTKDTGAIITEGGLGVEKNIHSGGTIKNDDSTDSTTKDTGSIVTEGGIGVEKTISAGGKLLIADTTDSTTKDTGSIITEGGIGAEKNIVNGGYLKSGKGRWPTGYLWGTYTGNNIFDALSPSIPNTNDEIRVSGGAAQDGVYLQAISHAIRYNSTTIRIYGILYNFTTNTANESYLSAINGSGSSYELSISW